MVMWDGWDGVRVVCFLPACMSKSCVWRLHTASEVFVKVALEYINCGVCEVPDLFREAVEYFSSLASQCLFSCLEEMQWCVVEVEDWTGSPPPVTECGLWL